MDQQLSLKKKHNVYWFLEYQLYVYISAHGRPSDFVILISELFNKVILYRVWHPSIIETLPNEYPDLKHEFGKLESQMFDR